MKLCGKCNQRLEDAEFYWKNRSKNSLQSYCKRCLMDRQMYRWKKRKEDAIQLKGGKCLDCGGIFRPEVYTFHHLDPKLKEFSWNKGRLRNWDSVLKELDKCVLLCANCHILRHSREISTYLLRT